MGENIAARQQDALAVPARGARGAEVARRPGITIVAPSSARPARAPVARTEEKRSTGRKIVATLIGVLVAVNLAGLPYFLLSHAQRLRHPLHPWLKPTGYVGQTAGFLSLTLFLFLWLYPLRKKYRWLDLSGSLSRWLDVHVAAGLLIPLLAALHAAWQFRGLIGLGYAAMFVVCLSGIVGRYLYMRIPHSRDGLEMERGQIEEQRQFLLQKIAAATRMDPVMLEQFLAVDPLPAGGLNPLATVARMFRDDYRRWRATRSLRRLWRRSARDAGWRERRTLRETMKLARRQIALGQQIRMLDATQRVFRYWHVAHRPFAITALLAVLLHVVTAVALGVTWVG